MHMFSLYESNSEAFERQYGLLPLCFQEMTEQQLECVFRGLPQRHFRIIDLDACTWGPHIPAFTRVLPQCRELRTIYLDQNDLGPEDIRIFIVGLNASFVARLYLTHNDLGDEGAILLAQALRTNVHLRVLDCAANAIGDRGATAFAEALHENHTLWKLDLSRNVITDAGAIDLADALTENATLREFYLSENRLNGAGRRALVQAHRVNFSIELVNEFTNLQQIAQNKVRRREVLRLELCRRVYGVIGFERMILRVFLYPMLDV